MFSLWFLALNFEVASDKAREMSESSGSSMPHHQTILYNNECPSISKTELWDSAVGICSNLFCHLYRVAGFTRTLPCRLQPMDFRSTLKFISNVMNASLVIAISVLTQAFIAIILQSCIESESWSLQPITDLPASDSTKP